MKKIIYTILGICLLTIISCGPSEADIAKQEELKQTLVQLKSQLASAEARLEDIKTIHIGRFQSEKEQQIGDETKIIEDLKNQISDTEKQIK